MLGELLPKYLDTVSEDPDRSVAMTALHCIQEMLDSIGEPVLRVSEDSFHNIVSVVKNVLRGKVCVSRCIWTNCLLDVEGEACFIL